MGVVLQQVVHDIGGRVQELIAQGFQISAVDDELGTTINNLAQLDLRVDDVEATAVLKVVSGNKLASIALGATPSSSNITISADLIEMNGVNIDESGVLFSSNFNGNISNGLIESNGTSGWALDRGGKLVAREYARTDEDVEWASGRVLKAYNFILID